MTSSAGQSVQTRSYDELSMLDKRHVWHPFTQMKDYDADDPLIVARGQGIKLIDIQGREYYDGFSSVWLNVHGHNVPELNEAVVNQLGQVAHATLLGMSNVPAIELAAKLASIAPAGLNRVFYSDAGATGVEIALKMAFQYWHNLGHTSKQAFVTMKEAYHGDTIGAVSVGAIPLYHEVYKPLLFPSYTVPYPHPYRYDGPNSDAEAGAMEATLTALEQLLQQRADEIAALIVEPVVQGASGIVVMPQGCLREIARLTERYGVLLIADEVATGFARTGAMFACDLEGVSPDLMVVGKGLTGGYLPLAATLATDEIYAAFYADFEERKTFFHGHSYTGNPLACAVALENLRLFEEKNLVAEVRRKADALKPQLARLTKLPHVGDVRQQGLMIGIELVTDQADKTPYAWERRIGVHVCRRARELGMLTRPLGNVIVFMPPLVSTDEELSAMVDILSEAICDLTGEEGDAGAC
ncbi:adenosylmethionine--8-amino-7-oxononanoate transaminase [Paenibacillus abyssi]|uniref:Adenosylmethionine-8-amino-7-oxononanoate aminotransferase n=1 Tax=Paenibacillus abyssi TaxID=1340531 RepID=A0A917CMR6_9BACL|nr:adenosylmethionine--8-amino-7-oxononanoate transaminase [Paenibacillus abyssi]GGF92436.1 adenosylmethionine-8-amino-7-oxononanoate aminotransferase [Paenibacillus abyssi]